MNIHNQDPKPETLLKIANKIFPPNGTKLLTLLASISLPLFLISMGTNNAEAEQPNDITLTSSTSDRFTTPLALPKIKTDHVDTIPSIPPLSSKTKVVTVKAGDTLTHIFRRVGLGADQVYAVVQLKKTKTLDRLIPGQKFEFKFDNTHKLERLVYHIDETRKLTVQKKNNRFEVFEEKREYDARITYSKGTITRSLFDAAHDAGLSDNLTMDLASIFGWDIDFSLDIRQGDQFMLMYEQLFLDGEYVRDGNILAAEFVNQGRSVKAVRYTNSTNKSNYYSETGKSMRKAFLRSPVDFTRISSRFGKRHHPILKKRRSHKGVDYAAARGTPIKASGDGKIIWRGRKGGYGKAVIINHGRRYSTLYGHMNNYNRKAKLGSRVKQGQIIGYVGSTGRATGPHLHYEFRVNGVHRNPLTIKLPNAASIQKKYLSDFLIKSRPLLTQLKLIKNTHIALNDFQ